MQNGTATLIPWEEARKMVHHAGVGDRMVDLVDKKIGEVTRAPGSFPRDRHDPIVRRARVATYPYARRR